MTLYTFDDITRHRRCPYEFRLDRKADVWRITAEECMGMAVRDAVLACEHRRVLENRPVDADYAKALFWESWDRHLQDVAPVPEDTMGLIRYGERCMEGYLRSWRRYEVREIAAVGMSGTIPLRDGDEILVSADEVMVRGSSATVCRYMCDPRLGSSSELSSDARMLLAAKWALDNKFSNDERFMAYPLALAIKAGRWACEWGLLDYDMDALEQWVLEVFVPHNRKGTYTHVRTSQSVLLTYLMERQRNFLQVETDIRTGEMPAPNMPDPYVRIMPSHNDVFIRFATKENRLYIVKSDLTKWCKRAGLSVSNLVKTLKKEGIVLQEVLANPGNGVATLSTPSINCFLLQSESVSKLGFNVSMLEASKPVVNVAPQVL